MSCASFGLPSCVRQAGVTLVELLVTVALASIIAGVAVPSMTGLLADSRLSSQTDLLVAALNTARMEAVRQRADITVCPAADADTATACSATVGDWSKGWLVMRVSDSEILQRVQSKSGLSVVNTSSTPLALVTFTGTFGAVTAATGFTLCISGRKQQAVAVSASGHIGKSFKSTVCG